MLLKRGNKGPKVRDLQRRLRELGYNPGPVDGIFGPRTEAAVRAFQRDSKLVADGIVGPCTRANLQTPQLHEASRRPAQPSAPRTSSQNVPGPHGEPRWMAVARQEICTREKALGSESNPRIVQYHEATSLRAQDDRTPWCAAFVSWVLERAGIRSMRSAWAKSYLNWGSALDHPRIGAITVFHRGSGPPSSRGPGHVGFFVEDRGDSIILLGGNQRNHVNIKSYSKSRLLSYRWPPGQL
jgi:uncharacterized protein (TIGR02594 family)